ncbi:MAG: tetratricopeptide repeat protein [Holophagaceae bacterium]|nr:tetratricopeptide repeat protein [Holophagaceae bacterium]
MRRIAAFPIAILLLQAVPAMAQTVQEDPRALMLQARAKQRRGGGDDPQGAVQIYKRVITLVPQSAEAQLRLSESIEETGNMDGAVAPAQKALELDPRNAEAAGHLGLLQYRRAMASSSSLPEARIALQKATELLPNDAEVWARQGEVSELLKDSELALRSWLQVGRLRPSITIAWERALIQAKSLDRYEARREAAMALCSGKNPDPRHLRMLDELAREQIKIGYLAHAEESFRLLSRHLPESPEILENVALIQVRTARFDEALKSLQQAEKLKPSDRISFNMALALMNLGRFQEAEAQWRRLLPHLVGKNEETVSQQNARILFANCLLLQNHGAEALPLINAWRVTKDDGELAVLRAESLLALEDWKGARAALKEGIAKFPKMPLFLQAAALPKNLFNESFFAKKESRTALMQLYYEGVANAFAEFRQWDRCLEYAGRARNVSKQREIELLLLQSNALDQLGRAEEALKVLREAQKVDPANSTLQNNLGYLLLEKGGDLQEASDLIEAAVKQDPQNGSVMDSWGWVLYKQGKFEESEKALRKASELNPFSPDTRMHLGEVLLKLNRPEETVEQWERALAFIFPGRATLDKRLAALRADIAKRNASPKGPAPKDSAKDLKNREDKSDDEYDEDSH